VWFVLLSFGLAWVPFLILLVRPGAADVAPILMPIAPAIACLVVRKWITREGLGDAGLRLDLRHWPLFAVAVLWPFAASFLRVPLALVFHAAPAGFSVPWGLASPSPLSLLTWSLAAIALAPIIFGEELGWRGYLQVRLLADRPLLAGAATGLIWGVWHYPLILVGGEQTAHPLLALLVFPLGTVTMAIFLGWLRLRTGGVWAGSVAHSANNVTEDSLGRLAFTGHASGTYPESAWAPTQLAEMVVLLGIVVGDVLWQRRRTAGDPGDSSPRPVVAA